MDRRVPETNVAIAREATERLSPSRTHSQEALAAAVRAASDGALSAFQAAAADRRRVRERESGIPDSDLLGDIELLDDELQGIAQWVLSGRVHPHVDGLLNHLENLGSRRTELASQCVEYPLLRGYLDALEKLRVALVDFHEE